MPIVLLTDFGLKDPYVGLLKGVIAGIAPQTPVIDLTHEIPSFQISQAAFTLFQSYRYFPKGSIFLAVVDPGVGTSRAALLIKTKDYFFLAPDNGLLSLVLEQEKAEIIVRLENKEYFLDKVSKTFHGRDIFAPVAAHLSRGVSPAKLGPVISHYQKLDLFFPTIQKKKICGKIVSVDSFGNAITNLSRNFIEKNFPNFQFQVRIKKKKIAKLYSHYAEAKKGEVFLLFGSSDFLEIAAHQGSAAKKLQLKIGDSLEVL